MSSAGAARCFMRQKQQLADRSWRYAPCRTAFSLSRLGHCEAFVELSLHLEACHLRTTSSRLKLQTPKGRPPLNDFHSVLCSALHENSMQLFASTEAPPETTDDIPKGRAACDTAAAESIPLDNRDKRVENPVRCTSPISSAFKHYPVSRPYQCARQRN